MRLRRLAFSVLASSALLTAITAGGCGGQVFIEPSATGGMGGMPVMVGSVASNVSSTAPSSVTGFPVASSVGVTVSSSVTGFVAASSTGDATVTSSTSGFPAASSAVSSAASSSSSSGMSSPCDMGTCTTCQNCAENSTCTTQVFNCEFDPDCSAILCCAANCTSSACVQNCINLDPAGQALFTALTTCITCACVVSCAVPAGTCP